MSDDRMEALRGACTSPPEHPSPESTRAASQYVMDAMLDDFFRLDERSIGLTGTRAELEGLLREPPPELGGDFGQVLAEVRDKIVHHALRSNHPRFLAFVPGAPTFASILGDCLASSTNLFAGVWLEAAGAAQVEVLVLDWFKQFLGFPAEASGVLTSGGSEANLTALVVARNQVARADRARLVLYTSAERHRSIDRAASIMGIHPEQIETLQCDSHFRLDVQHLRERIASDQARGQLPWLVVASAGTTNTGAVDPLADIADLAQQQDLWLHVDAAYGWPMALIEQGKALLHGIDRADSITLDPHKWFAQSFEAGCVLIRRGSLLGQTFAVRPDYMQDVVPRPGEINFCDHGLALTRRFRALKIWFSIKLLGIAWFRRLVEHGCALAEYAQALLEQAGGFEIISPRSLSVVCFRCVPLPQTGEPLDALQHAIAERLRLSGRAFLSTTRLRGCTALRICFVNWRTTAADVEEVVALLQAIGADLAPRRDR